jgi:glycosyltransferase involved in cell wall biosynthesis
VDNLDNLPDKHYSWNIVRSSSVNTFSKLTLLLRKYKPVTLCIIGNIDTWPTLKELPYEYTKKFVFFSSLQDVTSDIIENKYISSITKDRFSPSTPLFSVITTTFHSGKKIFRPYESLKNQTYKNWEWILWDDSKEDHKETFEQILKFQEEDIRIQCYRASYHSGFIGEMKWRSAALSRGEWLVELDHDDIIDSRLFQWCNEAIAKCPDADFICSSCVELHEDDEEVFSYGDFTAFGYACYHKEWLRGKWHNVYHVPHVNPKTVRHIVGSPNHVRIWRRTFYEKIGKHNQDFPVTDDYELILRSILNGKWIYLDAPTYFQFRNHGGNNFTFLRNSLIQYLKDKTRDLYEADFEKYWKLKNIPNNYSNIFKAWENPNDFTYNKGFFTFTPNTTDDTVSIILTVENENEIDILKAVNSICNQIHTDWLLFIIGNKSSTLDRAMNLIRQLYDDSIINKIRWWNLETKLTTQTSINYAHRMLINTKWIAYIQPNKKWDSHFLLNSLTNLKNTNKSFVCDSNQHSLLDTVHNFELLRKFDEFSENSLKSLLAS